MEAGYISIIILVAAIILYVTNLIPITITAMLSSAAMVIFGVIPAGRAWAAFGQDSVLIMAGVILIGSTLFSTGAASVVGDLLIKIAGGKPKLSIFLMLAVSGAMSMVLSNTTCTVMFLPLILSVVIEAKDNKIVEQKYMQMLCVMTSVGGLVTLIGSPINVASSGLMEAAGYPPFTFGQMAAVSLMLFVVSLLYTFTLGDKIAEKIFGVGANLEHSDFVKNFIVEKEELDKKAAGQKLTSGEQKKAGRKKIYSTVILVVTIGGLITQQFHGISLGTVAIIGGIATVLTGCTTVKDMYKKIDWGTLMLLAGTIGCAAGLAESGGGRIIANFFIGLLGDSITPMAVFVVMSLIAAVITQFMSNTGTCAILIPVGLALAEQLGMNALPIAVGIVMCASLSFMTPMASPTQALVLNWGSYKFMDYVKYSGPITVILDVLVIILTPIFFPLI
ncbi:MAG: anion permease [Clostridiales bacterium]|nr:anion permease [Clostridiales bacterium]